MANRPFQGYTLFQMLKASAPDAVVKREDIAKKLGVNEGSVPIYFFGLKKYFGVECELVKDGRSVVGYKLLTRDIEVPENGRRGGKVKAAPKPKTVKVKATKPAKATIQSVTVRTKAEPKRDVADVIDDMQIDEIGDNELSDIRAQLGL
jgi:hypothetical protein